MQGMHFNFTKTIYYPMRVITLSAGLLLFALNSKAQFDIHLPIVNEGPYAITDTVYMAPDGNDNHPGTLDKPVRTFSRALSLIPFKSFGLRTYGLVRLLPGIYYTDTGFIQEREQWEKNGAYKNVSVEGIGDVLIQGPSPAQPATNHLIRLSGSHIFIRNVRLKYGNLNGIYIHPYESRPHDILIENVQVDSVKGFGILIKKADKVEIRYSAARYSSRLGEEDLSQDCKWPSGIKFLGCTHATIHHSLIAYTRGEGLNFHNTLYGKAYRNILHDNPTQFYADNSARLLIYQNYLYNTPGIGDRYWKTCPQVEAFEAGKAFLLANEGACVDGNFPRFEYCLTKCAAPDETFHNVDSVFIFNNFIQNSGRFLDFWQGNVNVLGTNCIKNVFIWHNTFIGTLQKSNHKVIIANLFFPDYTIIGNHGAVMNTRVQNNIFAFNPESAIVLNEAFNPKIQAHEKDYLFASNLWSKAPPISNTVSGSNKERSNMRYQLLLLGDTALHYVVPFTSSNGDTLNKDFFYSVPAIIPEVAIDYRGFPRNKPMTNIGAFEIQSSVSTSTIVRSEKIRLYPVPTMDELWLELSTEHLEDEFAIEIYDYNGRCVSRAQNVVRIPCNHLNSGVYHLIVRSKTWMSQGIFVKVR